MVKIDPLSQCTDNMIHTADEVGKTVNFKLSLIDFGIDTVLTPETIQVQWTDPFCQIISNNLEFLNYVMVASYFIDRLTYSQTN